MSSSSLLKKEGSKGKFNYDKICLIYHSSLTWIEPKTETTFIFYNKKLKPSPSEQ